MINLNKQRIAVYMYLLLVFSLIFGLSFSVQGNKITGSFILEIGDNIIGKISTSFYIFIIFGFLISLVFSLFIIRHAQEIKKDIKPEKIKYFVGIVIVLLAVSFLSFGVYFGGSKDKITGFASQEQPSTNAFIPGQPFDFDKRIAIPLGNGVYQARDAEGQWVIFDTQSSRGTVMYATDPEDANFINGYDKEGRLFFSGSPTRLPSIIREAWENIDKASENFRTDPNYPKASNFGSGQGDVQLAQNSNKVSSEEVYEGAWFFGTNLLKDHTIDRVTVVTPSGDTKILELEAGTLRTSIGKRILEFVRNPQDYTETEIKALIPDSQARIKVLEIYKLSVDRRSELEGSIIADSGVANDVPLIGSESNEILIGGSGDDLASAQGRVKLAELRVNSAKNMLLSCGGNVGKCSQAQSALLSAQSELSRAEKELERLQIIPLDIPSSIEETDSSETLSATIETMETEDVPEEEQFFPDDDDYGPATEELNREKVISQAVYKATFTLLDLTLGEFAYGFVTDYCKEQYDSSDYEGGQSSLNYNANTQSLLAGQTNSQTQQNNCIGNQTTLTAQGQKSIINTGFTYQTSWTITPCKENVQYTIYLANSIDDNIGIATGVANKGIVKSESKQFSYTKNYQFVCIQVSDTSVGNNGYACFNVV